MKSVRSEFWLKYIRMVVLVLIFGLIMSTFCFADGDVFSEANGIMSKITTGIRTICVSGAILAGTIACLMWMFGTSQRTIEAASFWGKRIVVGLILIGLMASLVNTFFGYTSA